MASTALFFFAMVLTTIVLRDGGLAAIAVRSWEESCMLTRTAMMAVSCRRKVSTVISRDSSRYPD